MHAQRSMKAAYTHAMRDRRIVRNQDSHEFTDSSRGERLQRVMADAGVASRRECEALILAGEVVDVARIMDSKAKKEITMALVGYRQASLTPLFEKLSGRYPFGYLRICRAQMQIRSSVAGG